MNSRAATDPPSPRTLSRSGRIVLFGHEPMSGRVEVTPRPRSWRTRKALLPVAIGIVVAPLAALVPPHAPWALIALAVGGYRGRLRWKERYTIQGFEGACPRCEEPLRIAPGTRLRHPHPLSCPECGHESMLEVPELGNGDAGSR